MEKKGRHRRSLVRGIVAASFVFMLVPFFGFFQPWHYATGTDVVQNQFKDFSGCLGGSVALRPLQARLAFVVPTFTLTPYNHMKTSFYAFYAKYKTSSGAITTDLKMLTTKVVNWWNVSSYLSELSYHDFLNSPAANRCGIVSGYNLRLTDDVAIDRGSLFSSSHRSFDVLIMGHEEYVTRAEYRQLKQFVSSGGRIVEMTGNTFWAQVNYSQASGMETFVAGHGYEYNGTAAWHTNYEPYDSESSGWYGSTFANGVYTVSGALVNASTPLGSMIAQLARGPVAFTDYTYSHDEVNYVRNFTGTQVIARYFNDWYYSGNVKVYGFPSFAVDAYSHAYRQGSVYCLCIFGESIIGSDRAAQLFLVYSVSEGYGRVF